MEQKIKQLNIEIYLFYFIVFFKSTVEKHLKLNQHKKSIIENPSLRKKSLFSNFFFFFFYITLIYKTMTE